jgi:hypothetical protein
VTLLDFQISVAQRIGRIALIAQAGCLPVAENAGDMVQKIETQIDNLGLCCVVRTPAINLLGDANAVQVQSLIIGFAEQPLVNRGRANAVSALDAASFAALDLLPGDSGIFPKTIRQREEDGLIIAELDCETSFTLS